MTTVAKLIEALSKFPQEMRVIVSGYEGGYCDVGLPSIRSIELNVNEAWYYGPHDDSDEKIDEEAVFIPKGGAT